MSDEEYSQEFSPNPAARNGAQTQREPETEELAQVQEKHKNSNNDCISIADFDPMGTKRINSPRSLEACKLEGIMVKELLHVPKSKFREPGLPPEVAELRYEFHENKRKELIDLIKSRRDKLIEELDRSTYDHPTMAGSTQYQTSNGKFLSGRSVQTSKSVRSNLDMKSSALIGDAMNKDKEVTRKQMELIKRIKEKEQKRFEKYLINEERKNQLIEEKEARFEYLRNQTREGGNREREEGKEIKAIKNQKLEEIKAEKERKAKEQELKLKEQRRLEKVKKCEQQQQKHLEENERRMKKMNEKYNEQMKKTKELHLQKKKEAKQKAIEKRMKIQQIFKAKEEQEQRDLARYLKKQQQDHERDLAKKKEKAKALRDIQRQAEEKNEQKDRILKQAEERMAKKINIWLDKQKEADKRLEKLKEQERVREILRREFIQLNNQSKFYNKKRFQRKIKYQEDKMRAKIALKDMKIEAMAEQKYDLKNVRTQALSDMEKQRQDIKNALYHMTVWNSFSPAIVNEICNSKKARKNRTIEEMVRVNAAKEHIKKTKKHRSGSAIHLRPIKSSQSSNKNLRAVQSQQDIQHHEEDDEYESEQEIDEEME
ncbi:unnamed protein product [Moneuplotes crassus]|uniref:Uncharacterized protein n=1 Tax=Euplotes crassus TaxID=5936 RepID=A0AAD1U745_EUPCR|nr:unnamed protein product [Moneuplotes crassus]